MTSCVHFTGVQNNQCKAGVSYSSFRPLGLKIPCVTPGAPGCSLCRFPTPEEVAEQIAASDAAYARMELALTVVHADAKAKGFRRGHGGGSSLPCPVCQTGTLAYSVSGCNGHIHGRCGTEGCVWWMQ